MIWIKLASFFMFTAVGLGAFGAHALRDKLTEHHFRNNSKITFAFKNRDPLEAELS